MGLKARCKSAVFGARALLQILYEIKNDEGWPRDVLESTRSRNGTLNGIGIEINILTSLKPMANDSILRLPASYIASTATSG